MPTAAPISVSLIRSVAAASAPPTASTSIALIGTSSMCGPSRSSCPSRIDTAISAPRLHQDSPTMLEKPTASSTPAVTLATRCTPLVTMSFSVISTTSSAVSGARIGTVSGNSTCATTKAATAAPVSRRARPMDARPRSRSLTRQALMNRRMAEAMAGPAPFVGNSRRSAWTHPQPLGSTTGKTATPGRRVRHSTCELAIAATNDRAGSEIALSFATKDRGGYCATRSIEPAKGTG